MNRLGPTPLDLALPADLAAVDPAGLRTRATEHRGDGQVAAEQARALRAAVVKLVPAAWLGLGSLSFAEAALLQAGSLELIAAACADLATALDALATRLEWARADALAAVRSGHRLDDEIAADNAAWSRRPEPERADPDPVRLAARDEDARLLTARLAGATETARAAWLQATAAFDLVAYRMPALAARMTGTGSGGTPDQPAAADDWRPSASLSAMPADERRRLLGLLPGCVGVGWAGSGALLGPDGRRYPLVVPWVEENGARWTGDQDGAAGDTATLDGADSGWHEIGVRVGLDTFGPAASTATKAAIATAGFVGNAPRMVGRLRPDLLPQLRFTTLGVPSVSPGPAVPVPRAAGTAQIPRAGLVRDGEELTWRSDRSSGTGSRSLQRNNPELGTGTVAPAGPNLVGLTGSGLTGLSTANRMDDDRVAAYRATFEENDDGRIRARVTTYRVLETGGGPAVLAEDVSAKPDGRMTREPVRYRPPANAVWTAAPQERPR